MSIATELTRIQTAKADIKASIEAKGVTVPSSALIDEYADYVDEISGGGGQAEEDLKNLIERDITSITIPNGTTTIGNYAFYGCSGLTSVTIPNTVTSIGDVVFRDCTYLTDIIIPNSVTSIGTYTFYYCTRLTSITLNNVTSIGTYAFQDCSGLTSVTIGNDVTSIGQNAFRNCTRLTSITILATTPPTIGSATFNNTNSCPIYIPAESVETYKTAWNTYASRIQAIPSE